MTKAFVYLRVSGLGQVEGDGFTRQREVIARYAEENGVEIVKEFRELGVSGTKELENRPALSELILAILSNGVRLVLVEKLDRLARDLMIQETIIADFEKRGIRLVSVMEPDLCSQDPSRKLVRQIMGAISEYEKTMLVLKTRAARQRIRARGERCEGQKPFGERDGERDTLALMQQLRREGTALDTIATTLNREGHQTRREKRWHAASVRKILKRQAT